MQRIDLLIGAVLIIAVLGSAAGALLYEDARVGADFSVTWQTRAVTLADVTGAQTGPGATDLTFELNESNLTRLQLDLTIAGTPPRVQPVAINIEVTPPNGTAPQTQDAQLPAGQGASVQVPFTFDLAALPTTSSIQASDPEAAERALAASHTSTNGMGTWTVTIRFASTAPGPLSGEAFRLTLARAATAYEPSVAPQVPEVAG